MSTDQVKLITSKIICTIEYLLLDEITRITLNMEMQEFTNNDPDHTGEADDNTSDLQTAPEDNHQVSSDNTGEDNTSGEDTSPTSDPPIQTSEGNHEVSADNTNEASSGETGKK